MVVLLRPAKENATASGPIQHAELINTNSVAMTEEPVAETEDFMVRLSSEWLDVTQPA
jgi:hypothetical protein